MKFSPIERHCIINLKTCICVFAPVAAGVLTSAVYSAPRAFHFHRLRAVSAAAAQPTAGPSISPVQPPSAQPPSSSSPVVAPVPSLSQQPAPSPLMAVAPAPAPVTPVLSPATAPAPAPSTPSPSPSPSPSPAIPAPPTPGTCATPRCYTLFSRAPRKFVRLIGPARPRGLILCHRIGPVRPIRSFYLCIFLDRFPFINPVANVAF